MIGTLGELAGQQNARKLRILLIVMIAEGVLAGIALVMLVPILRAASEKNFPEAWSWLAVMALFCGLFAIVRLGSQLYGFNLSIEVGRALFDRMGTHLGQASHGMVRHRPHRRSVPHGQSGDHQCHGHSRASASSSHRRPGNPCYTSLRIVLVRLATCSCRQYGHSSGLDAHLKSRAGLSGTGTPHSQCGC